MLHTMITLLLRTMRNKTTVRLSCAHTPLYYCRLLAYEPTLQVNKLYYLNVKIE